jgi:hypothetical protein
MTGGECLYYAAVVVAMATLPGLEPRDAIAHMALLAALTLAPIAAHLLTRPAGAARPARHPTADRMSLLLSLLALVIALIASITNRIRHPQ